MIYLFSIASYGIWDLSLGFILMTCYSDQDLDKIRFMGLPDKDVLGEGYGTKLDIKVIIIILVLLRTWLCFSGFAFCFEFDQVIDLMSYSMSIFLSFMENHGTF